MNQKQKNPYSETDVKWTMFHRRILIGISVASIVIEILTAVLLTVFHVFEANSAGYIWQYIVVPGILVLVLAGTACIATRGERIKDDKARYVISLVFVGICAVMYVAHGFFSSMYLPFLAALVMTTIYGDYVLTTITFACSFIGMILGKLMHGGDTAQNVVMSSAETRVDFLFALLMLTGLYLIALCIILFERQKRVEGYRKMEEQLALQQEVVRDELTGLYNRKALRQGFDEMLGSSGTYSFLMVDLNHFKKLNDTYGHATGDLGLKYFAEVLSRQCMPHRVFRYGGDEFCVIFHETTEEQIELLCKNIQSEILRDGESRIGAAISASFGFAEYTAKMQISELISTADEALYQAKTKESHICRYSGK